MLRGQVRLLGVLRSVTGRGTMRASSSFRPDQRKEKEHPNPHYRRQIPAPEQPEDPFPEEEATASFDTFEPPTSLLSGACVITAGTSFTSPREEDPRSHCRGL